MEKHLNLFYSYNQGNLSSSERIKQLEDNLTRALIVTVKSLEISNQNLFIKTLLGKDSASKSFVFDLQNTNNYDKKSISEKFVIILQRNKSTFTIGDFKNLKTSFLENKSEQEKTDIVKKIKKHLASEDESDILIENVSVKYSELNSILQLLYGNRADAWIIGEKETLLFETKIGNNTVSKYQIFRHITGKNGFNLKQNELTEKNSKISIINITWDEICSIFLKLKETANQREQFLISEFIEYISMTGQKLNLNYIIKGDIDAEIHREQFSLFLNQLDEKIKKRDLPFERQNRNKSGLWEPYGIRISPNEVLKDPHYTIGFRDDKLAISLTTKNKKQINSEFLELVEKYFEDKVKNSKTLFRYNFRMVKYAILDKVAGQMQGERKEPFMFYVQFSEIGKNIKSICNILLKFSKMNIYKQFELDYELKFYDFSKIREMNQESQIRYLNKHLLENPTELVEEFVSFMEETSAMYNQMSK
ncbi:hypothetical protein BH20ACI4_BH20ACI4_16840 [soil metagenome]